MCIGRSSYTLFLNLQSQAFTRKAELITMPLSRRSQACLTNSSNVTLGGKTRTNFELANMNENVKRSDI